MADFPWQRCFAQHAMMRVTSTPESVSFAMALVAEHQSLLLVRRVRSLPSEDKMFNDRNKYSFDM
jgi:hypothetical protein